MHWLYYTVLILIHIFGVFLTLVGLPGIWLMIAATAGYAWLLWDFGYVSGQTLIALLVIGIIAEIVEFIAGAAGAKSAGGSRRAAVGAILGGLIGGLFLSVIPVPVVSTIVGACLGAFIGATLAEYSVAHRHGASLRVGVAAAKGRLWGILSKLGFAVIILLITFIAALPW
jgi:uncharacterized protein